MTPAAARTVAEVLERGWGWRFDGPGLRRLDRALEEVAAATGTSKDDVAARTGQDPELRHALLDRATVQETSWFRDAAAFRALASTVLPAVRHRPVRIWSAGCAYGQEVWSLAMLCAEQGVAVDLVASDVSRPALAVAEAGEYVERQLRGLSHGRRIRWLDEVAPGRYRVRDELRRGVRFATHDLISTAPPLTPGSVDLVLCRYVLIYLSDEGIARVLRRVEDLLRPGSGRLLVGGAESLWHLTERFQVLPLDGAFAYRVRATAGVVAAGPRPRPRRAPAPRTADPGPVEVDADVDDPPAVTDHDALLAEGEAAVAQGDLHDAVRAFRAAAYLDPDSALAHLQLGLALEGLGDLGAARAFRAALAALRRGRSTAVDGWRAAELERLVGAKLGELR